MQQIKGYVLCIYAVMLCCKGFAQVFGGNPPSLKWQQINTSASRVIFPKGLDSTAQRITNIITYMNTPMQATIGSRQKKIDLVLQNQTTISNAYVGLAPFRSEFYLTPDQNSFELGSLPWPDQLAIHEFRHVQQYNNFNVGVSKTLHDIFGENAQSLANNSAIPNWFFEGDAVYNETNVSKQGRGSLPFFYNGYRALWKDGKSYSWMKLRNGSYKDFTPDHYKLGFMLVAYGREKYGDQFWEHVTHDAAAFKGLFYPFQKAIKKYAGIDYVHFRNDALNFFKKQFNLENVLPQNKGRHKEYVDEQYPVYAGADSILFVKSSFSQIPEFVIRTGNKEHKIRVKDYSLDNHFSYRNGKVIYAAYRPDERWGYKDYSDVKILNVNTGKQQTLTSHTKYFSPDISADGKEVIAVNETPDLKYSLHLLNAFTGKLIKVIPDYDHLFYTYPKFYTDTQIISAVRNAEGKMSLALININDGKINYLTPFSYNVIGFPFIANDTIYFSYSYHKNDELFAYTFSDKKLWILKYEQHGVGKYQPSVNASNAVWSTFTADGYKLQQVSKHAIQFQEMKPDDLDKTTSAFGITALQKTNANLLYGVPDDTFSIKKYSQGGKLLNFHSLQPTISDPDYSLDLLGENILNTLQSQVSFIYNRSERYKTAGFSGTYSQLFPFLTAGINYTFDRRGLYHNNIVAFNELEPFAGFDIPLNLSKNKSFTYLDFGSQYIYNQSNFRGAYKDSLGKISYSYISNFLTFTHQVQSAVQQIFPKLAQTLSVSYKTALTHYKGFQYVVNGHIYLPGFFINHSLVLNGAYLHRDTSAQVDFSSNFPFSRGYSAVNLYKMYKWGVDYNLPLVYPDAGFADVVYFLRIRGNLFYDNTYAKDFSAAANPFAASFRSTGAEIYFDTKWWNEAAISFGIRYSRLIDKDLFGGTGSNRWEIILPVNILKQ